MCRFIIQRNIYSIKYSYILFFKHFTVYLRLNFHYFSDACVKIYLMYEGKQLKRVKTTVRASDLNPVFNESFSFDVPNAEVEKVYFSLAVCHYDAENKSSTIIGRVYIGMKFDASAREHWSSMVQNPRKKIVSSYKITN